MSNNASDQPCRLCGEAKLVLRLRLEHSPRTISRLLREAELGSDTPVDLDVYECEVCGFVQLMQILDSDFYDDYLMTVSHSAQMRSYQSSQAVDFVTRFDLVGKRVIEVGAGDGNYMEYLRQAGADVTGIEPSAPFRGLAQQRGLPVLPGYVDAQNLVPGAPYDGFVTRQVLEHVPDPNSFLQGIRKSLAPGAAGLVEVPSLEQAVEGGRFYDFFPDHLNYFSARTLRYALERNKFDVTEVVRGMNGEYNVALVRVGAGSGLAELQSTVDSLSGELKAFIAAYRSAGKRVAVWGSGGKGIATLAVAGIRDVAYVVDSDPHKQGLFTPVSHLPVVGPDALNSDPVDAVILTALAYKNEIIHQLRKDIGFTGPIALLGPHLSVVEQE